MHATVPANPIAMSGKTKRREAQVVFQLATTCNPLVVSTRPTGDGLKPLVEHLIPVYGESHLVKVVHSGAFLLEKTEIIDLRLSDIADDGIDLERRPTLYVPPVH